MRATATFDPSIMEGTWSYYGLAVAEFFDTNLGAAEWSTRHVAVVTALVLALIRLTLRDAYNINWYAFIHGAVSGYLSFIAVWLSVFAAVPLTGAPEPDRSILCHGPLTSLHRIVPAITMGFGLFDVLDGFEHGIDFVRSIHFSLLWTLSQ